MEHTAQVTVTRCVIPEEGKETNLNKLEILLHKKNNDNRCCENWARREYKVLANLFAFARTEHYRALFDALSSPWGSRRLPLEPDPPDLLAAVALVPEEPFAPLPPPRAPPPPRPRALAGTLGVRNSGC